MNIHAEYVAIYYSYRGELNGFKPTNFSGADAKSIKLIRLRIEKILTEPSDENSIAIWQAILNYLLKNRDGKEKWLSRQPLTTINQRLDEILASIKNERTPENFAQEIEQWDGK